ncbi:MAG: AMP-binding protein [Gammaproteobacteria bacterium]|nr:MAG: AMP-binding protein [Gammaproteobacteria bacterium]
MPLSIDGLGEGDVGAWYRRADRAWGDVLDQTAAAFPDREAVVFGDQRLSYSELRSTVDRFARALIAIGVHYGDQVAVWMTGCPEWVIAQFAIYKIGARLVPLNTRFKAGEVQYSLAHSDATTLILQSTFLNGSIPALDMLREICTELDCAAPGALHSENLPRLRNVVCLGAHCCPGVLSWSDVLAAGLDVSKADLARAQEVVNGDDICQIMYTSGTTGAPKGAMIAHRTNQCGLAMLAKRVHMSSSDTILAALPLFTNFGCMLSVAVAICYGARMVIQATFDPEESLRLIEREQVTILLGTPTMFIMLQQHPKFAQFDVRSLRSGIIGGAPAPVSVIEAMANRLGLKDLLGGYGLVEGGGVSSATLENDTLDHVATTVGRPMPFCEVRIVNTATGQPAVPEESGEICVRERFRFSHHFKSYYKDPIRTAETIDSDGWLHTGDLGRIDDQGYLVITGRLKDMYICGGFNVYPAEVENALHRHPGIKQAAVIGVPDVRLGEVGMAFVVLNADATIAADAIIGFCRRQMANTKVPRFVHFLDQLPLTATGKVQKFVLREVAERLLADRVDPNQ